MFRARGLFLGRIEALWILKDVAKIDILLGHVPNGVDRNPEEEINNQKAGTNPR